MAEPIKGKINEAIVATKSTTPLLVPLPAESSITSQSNLFSGNSSSPGRYYLSNYLLASKISSLSPPSQQSIIEDSLRQHSREVSGFHALRTRRAGSQSHIDLHLVMASDISLEQAHQICDQIEVEIQNVLHEASIIIHAEPCDNECEQCSAICSKRRTS